MSVMIQTEHLSKIFKTNKVETKAVHEIHFAIEQNETIAITGKSGSGKTTLLHMLGGLEVPSDGEVFLNGVSIYKLNKNDRCRLRRKNIGFVFQFFNLIPELSVYENIILPTLLDGKDADQEYIDYLTSLLGIREKIQHYPSQLSGGQQQRVAIARALANRPAILFADEPTGNLDDASSQEVISLFHKCQKELGQTLVIVTHDHEIAQQMHRIIMLKDGQITSDSSEG